MVYRGTAIWTKVVRNSCMGWNKGIKTKQQQKQLYELEKKGTEKNHGERSNGSTCTKETNNNTRAREKTAWPELTISARQRATAWPQLTITTIWPNLTITATWPNLTITATGPNFTITARESTTAWPKLTITTWPNLTITATWPNFTITARQSTTAWPKLTITTTWPKLTIPATWPKLTIPATWPHLTITSRLPNLTITATWPNLTITARQRTATWPKLTLTSKTSEIWRNPWPKVTRTKRKTVVKVGEERIRDTHRGMKDLVKRVVQVSEARQLRWKFKVWMSHADRLWILHRVYVSSTIWQIHF